jgi:hypothetical protein
MEEPVIVERLKEIEKLCANSVVLTYYFIAASPQIILSYRSGRLVCYKSWKHWQDMPN